MRIRRKKWARPELEVCEYFIRDPIEYKGKWQEQFDKKQPIHLEIGCGKGIFIATLSSQNTNINYIGIDIKPDMLGYTRRNIENTYQEKELEINNVLISAYNVELIYNILDREDRIERIYINFCNPWPKTQHKKRRLTHSKHLEKYKEFLVDEGEIYFKTDDDELFNDSIKYFDESGFKILKSTKNLHEYDIFNGNIMTEHEKMFSDIGIKIKALIARKIN